MTEETKPIVFTDQGTLQGFQALVTEDPMVHIAGVFSGKLSAIPEDVARAMVKRKSNLLKEKGEPAKAKAPAEVKELAKAEKAEVKELAKAEKAEAKELAKAEKAEAKAEAKPDRTEAKDLPREEAKMFTDPNK